MRPIVTRLVLPVRLRSVCRGCALLVLTMAAPDALRAQSGWHASLSLISDYVVRGYSMTQGAPAAQMGGHWETDSGWLVGAWTSQVDLNPGPGATYEVDIFAGGHWQVGNRWQIQALLTRYVFPNDSEALDWDYTEIALSAELDGMWSASLIYSPDMSRYSFVTGPATDQSAFACELAARLPLRAGFAFVAGIGMQDLDDLFGERYLYGSAGLAFTRAPWDVSVVYVATDATAKQLFGAYAADRWSATVMLRF